MRKTAVALVLLAVLVLPNLASAEIEAVRSGFGSLIIGGVFQGGFNYYLGDEVMELVPDPDDETGQNQVYGVVDRRSNAEFLIHYARLNFKGTIIDDKVRYFVQLDLNADPETEGEVRLLDMKLGLKYIPYTTLWFGRFAPDFTYFNPINVARLMLIDYPLMNRHLGIQRQTGVEVSVDHKFFGISIGATNGLNLDTFAESLNPPDRLGRGLGNDTFEDENTMKDLYFTGAVKPVDGMRIWAGYWWGNPLDYFEAKGDGELKPHQVKAQLFNGGFAYLARFGLTIMGEVFYSKLKYDNEQANDTDRDEDFLELRTASYYGRLGFNMKEALGVPIEILGQYDYLNPDMEDDKDTHGKNDELTYITAGLNYYIKDWHAVMMANYIYKDETRRVLQKDGTGAQSGIDNDEIKLQIQVAF